MSPPARLPKKPLEQPDLEGIDLSDFDAPTEPVAGLKLEEGEAPQLPAHQAPAAPPPTAIAPNPEQRAPEAPLPPRESHHVEPARLPGAGAAPLALPPPPSPPSPPRQAAPPSPPPSAPLGYPYPVQGYPGYGAFPPAGYPYPVQGYPGYGAFPAPGYGYPVVFAQAPPPRPLPSETGVALTRLRAGALLGVAFFAVLGLQYAFEAASGVTDAPGVRPHAPVGLQFLSYFLYGTALLALGLALSAGASSLARLGEARGEFADTSQPPSRRSYQLIGVGLILPLATTVAAWLLMSEVQRTMPGSGTGSNLGLVRLFDNYRLAALVASAGQLAAAFLIVAGLSAALKPLAPLAPRKDFRAFGALFVTGAAVQSALTLVLFFALLAPPTVTGPESPVAAYGLLLAGPSLSSLALLLLARYLKRASAQAQRRHRAKADIQSRGPEVH